MKDEVVFKSPASPIKRPMGNTCISCFRMIPDDAPAYILKYGRMELKMCARCRAKEIAHIKANLPSWHDWLESQVQKLEQSRNRSR